MTTSELISYIEKQIKNNIAKEIIISKLIGAGWKMEDINEGFLNVESKLKTETIPLVVKIENQENKEIIVQTKEIEKPKIWVPMNIPVVSNVQKQEEKKEEIKKIDLIDISQAVKVEEPQKKEEDLIPKLSPKVALNSFGSIKTDNQIKIENPIITEKEDISKNYQIKDLPKIAMLSSYKKDSLSVNPEENNDLKIKNNKKSKWVIFISVIFLIALIVWVFVGGYVNIKDINFPFIKKDPKVLLLNNSKTLSSLKSYKTETNIEITSPSFADISAGLISGEATSPIDEDNISISTLGVISQNDDGLLSDNFVTIKSSLLKNYITTDIKNNGSDLFVSVPNLSQILGENTPEPTVVKINEAQFSLIPSLFSDKMNTRLRKFNFYNILSNGMSSYINNDTLNAYNDFINNADILGKGEEVIKGVDTYHYLITVDRQLSKKLLSKISDSFTLSLSDEDKAILDEILGATTIDSFDVWIGKGDNNIYQYNVVLKTPLSKIIGFEDGSIGNNQIKINWKTTYYDFNILNEILIPKDATEVEDFIKNINEMKIKNEIISFGQLASNLFKVESFYGSKANKNGSCMNPTSGSLFSPLGHSKKALTEVSSISKFLNKMMAKTNNNGFCYATSKAWSFTVSIADNYDINSIPNPEDKPLFCVDSTGAALNISSSPLGVVCMPVTPVETSIKDN